MNTSKTNQKPFAVFINKRDAERLVQLLWDETKTAARREERDPSEGFPLLIHYIFIDSYVDLNPQQKDLIEIVARAFRAGIER